MNIYLGLDNFKGESNIKTWAHKVTLNTCFKHIAKEVRERKRSHFFDINNFPAHVSYEKKVDFKIMVEFVSTFQPIDRELMYLYLVGESQKDIAAIMGLTMANVSTKLNRLKNIVQDHLNKGLQHV